LDLNSIWPPYCQRSAVNCVLCWHLCVLLRRFAGNGTLQIRSYAYLHCIVLYCTVLHEGSIIKIEYFKTIFLWNYSLHKWKRSKITHWRASWLFIFVKCILNDQPMEDAMDGACGTHEEENKYVSNFSVKKWTHVQKLLGSCGNTIQENVTLTCVRKWKNQ
jgi:hypothetical protein